MYVHSNMPLNNFFYYQQETVFLWKRRKKFMETDLTAVILYFARYFMSLCMVSLIDLWRGKFTLISLLLPAWIFFYFGNYLLDLHAGYTDYLKPSYIIISSIYNSSVSCNGRKEDSHRTIISCWCFRTFENSL